MPEIIISTAFKRDLKKFSGKDIDAMKSIIRILAAGDALPVRCKDHALTGNWVHYRDAHIFPDLLLIYRQSGDAVYLARIGSHSELSGKWRLLEADPVVSRRCEKRDRGWTGPAHHHGKPVPLGGAGDLWSCFSAHTPLPDPSMPDFTVPRP